MPQKTSGPQFKARLGSHGLKQKYPKEDCELDESFCGPSFSSGSGFYCISLSQWAVGIPCLLLSILPLPSIKAFLFGQEQRHAETPQGITKVGG